MLGVGGVQYSSGGIDWRGRGGFHGCLPVALNFVESNEDRYLKSKAWAQSLTNGYRTVGACPKRHTTVVRQSG